MGLDPGRGSAARHGHDLARIVAAMEAVAAWLRDRPAGVGAVEFKEGDDPVTATDRAIDTLLYRLLPLPGEGWLSEESADDLSRRQRSRVWVVDPLDGTREFVAGIPEWSVSVGLVEDGEAIAGGILNPTTGQLFVGAIGLGVTLNGRAVAPSSATTLAGATVLASRSEVKRGQWERFSGAAFTVRPTGSVAFKLACVAAGLADATWTLVPKHEWDVAAGVALARAAGCTVRTVEGGAPRFNQEEPLFSGLIVCPPGLDAEVCRLLGVASGGTAG